MGNNYWSIFGVEWCWDEDCGLHRSVRSLDPGRPSLDHGRVTLMDEWSRFLQAMEELKLLLEAVGGGEYCCLRHGLPYLRPSLLARQAFCEMQVELMLRRGVEKIVYRDERLLVEAILEARRHLVKAPSRPRIAISIPLAALVDSVPMLGRPDALLVEKGRIVGLVRLKIGSNRVSRSDLVRLYSYGLIVDYSPLPSKENLNLLLVTANSKTDAIGKLQALKQAFEENKPLYRVEGVHSFAYDRGYALQMLSPYLQYWVGARDLQASPSPAKCSRCELRVECPLHPVDQVSDQQ